MIAVAWLCVIAAVERPESYDGPVALSCRGETDRVYATAIERAREQIQGLRAERQIPGLSVAVAVKGHLVWSEGIGYADVEHAVPACPNTLFRTASVAKTFTAAAMGRLAERGRLDYETDVRRYVPSFPDKGVPITFAQLAGHRSGIRGYYDDRENLNRIHYTSVVDSLTAFGADPLVDHPGSRFLYSSYGFVLLSAAIEGAAKKPFLTIMKDEVLDPLGMDHTVAENSGQTSEHVAAFYDYVTPYSFDGRIHPSPPNDFSNKWAAGGFLSTAEDLVRLGTAHITAANRGFLSSATLNRLLRPQSGLSGVVGYGMGWISASDLHLRRVHVHFGAGSGATSVLLVYPDSGVVLAIMSNLGHAKFPFGRLVNTAGQFL